MPKIVNRFTGEIIIEEEAEGIAELAIKVKADLSGADLSEANLFRADLSRADLAEADLSGANLSEANLFRADLSGADLSEANLTEADLSEADLSEANLSRADLSGADLTRVKGINPYRTTPLLMLLDQPGAIRAYKLIQDDGTGPYAKKQGYEPVNYLVEEEFSVANSNTDVGIHCAAGISLATLDWCMREWKLGYRILLMEFTAADIAAIPTASDGKFRVYRCKRVGEVDLKKIELIKE